LRVGQPSKTRNIRRERQDFLVVNVVQHRKRAFLAPSLGIACVLPI
jgi:hypothetical protein